MIHVKPIKEVLKLNKNILVISTSLRSHSNSEALADAFIAGAESSKNYVEKISLKGKSISFCKGCLACQKTQKCVICDDASAITEKMHDADILVFATPIYYYEMSGQMKTLLDRSNPLFTSDYAFREIYMLTTAAENTPDVPNKAVNGLQGWIDCFEKATLAGSIFAGGVTEEDDITGHPSLKAAYDMGQSL